MVDKITYPVQVWEWISNSISHFTQHVITYAGIKVKEIPGGRWRRGMSHLVISQVDGRTCANVS